jgi:membrane fusion protein (multidrug efflux system)
MPRVNQVRSWTHHLFALALCSLVACGDNKPSTQGWSGRTGKPTSVVTERSRIEPLRDELKAVGTARAQQSVTLYSESAGVVTQVRFNPDATVNQGEVLLQLDAREEQLAVDLARVQRDESARLVQRYTSMNLRDANISESLLDTAKAELAAANIALSRAEVMLQRRQVRAPFAGHIGITDIDVGDRIDSQTAIASLDDRARLLIDFEVPESFIGHVQPGLTIGLRPWENEAIDLQGEVIAVDSRVDAASRTLTARVALNNDKDLFRPGMAFEILIEIERGAYVAVPDVSVQWGADGAYVWVVKDDRTAHRVDVALVRRLSGRLLISGGVQEGDIIVSEGMQAVREGLQLNVLDAQALDRDTRQQLASPTDPQEQPADAR